MEHIELDPEDWVEHIELDPEDWPAPTSPAPGLCKRRARLVIPRPGPTPAPSPR